MPKRNQHIVPHPNGWAVKKENSKRVTAIFDTQGEAISYGRDIAITQRCELVIHDRQGTVRKRRNYNHPRYAEVRYERVKERYVAYKASIESSIPASENAFNN